MTTILKLNKSSVIAFGRKCTSGDFTEMEKLPLHLTHEGPSLMSSECYDIVPVPVYALEVSLCNLMPGLLWLSRLSSSRNTAVYFKLVQKGFVKVFFTYAQ